jgi:tRNA pseudouridine55 synthase
VLESFRGTFDQVPPPFSAKKVAGTPAYKLARKDQAAPLPAVAVTVHTLDVLSYGDGLLRLKVRTSAGFYVRALAHDIGVRLGCGAHLEGLRRTRAGVFAVAAAIGLEALAQDPERAAGHLVPLHQLLPELPAVRLTPAGARKASHGNPIGASDADPKAAAFVLPPASSGSDRAELVRLLDPDGALIGIARVGPDGLLRPSVVLV